MNQICLAVRFEGSPRVQKRNIPSHKKSIASGQTKPTTPNKTMEAFDKVLGDGTPMYRTIDNSKVKKEEIAKSADALSVTNHSFPNHFQIKDLERNISYNLRRTFLG